MESAQKKFIEIYFKNLNQDQRRYFLLNISDYEVIRTIENLTNLFIQFPFYHNEIYNKTKDICSFDDISNWQKLFYLSVFREYKKSSKIKGNNSNYNDIVNLYNTLEIKNSSFQFLISINNVFKKDLDKPDKDLNILRDIIIFLISEDWAKEYVDIIKLRHIISKLESRINSEPISILIPGLKEDLAKAKARLSSVVQRSVLPPPLSDREVEAIEKQAQVSFAEMKKRAKENF